MNEKGERNGTERTQNALVAVELAVVAVAEALIDDELFHVREEALPEAFPYRLAGFAAGAGEAVLDGDLKRQIENREQ